MHQKITGNFENSISTAMDVVTPAREVGYASHNSNRS